MKPWLAVALILLGACARGPARPVAIDTSVDACASCRMIVSDVRLAAQIVATGEEPLVFDDIGCLRAYLETHPVARDGTIFVAEHRTGEWIDARRAIYTRTGALSTPMGSRIVAHATRQSREADSAAVGGEDVPVAAILGVSHIAGGRR